MKSSYVDDFYLIHNDKKYLRYCLSVIRNQFSGYGLEFNEKHKYFLFETVLIFSDFIHRKLNQQKSLTNWFPISYNNNVNDDESKLSAIS